MNKLIEQRVASVLLNHSESRDNDNVLLVEFWKMEMNDNGNYAYKTYEFFNMLYQGKVTNASTISRIRRKLQMHYPHLRGERYQKRLEEQDKVKQDLGYEISVDTREN
jgi:hypothetical protein